MTRYCTSVALEEQRTNTSVRLPSVSDGFSPVVFPLTLRPRIVMLPDYLGRDVESFTGPVESDSVSVLYC